MSVEMSIGVEGDDVRPPGLIDLARATGSPNSEPSTSGKTGKEYGHRKGGRDGYHRSSFDDIIVSNEECCADGAGDHSEEEISLGDLHQTAVTGQAHVEQRQVEVNEPQLVRSHSDVPEQAQQQEQEQQQEQQQQQEQKVEQAQKVEPVIGIGEKDAIDKTPGQDAINPPREIPDRRATSTSIGTQTESAIFRFESMRQRAGALPSLAYQNLPSTSSQLPPRLPSAATGLTAAIGMHPVSLRGKEAATPVMPNVTGAAPSKRQKREQKLQEKNRLQEKVDSFDVPPKAKLAAMDVVNSRNEYVTMRYLEEDEAYMKQMFKSIEDIDAIDDDDEDDDLD